VRTFARNSLLSLNVKNPTSAPPPQEARLAATLLPRVSAQNPYNAFALLPPLRNSDPLPSGQEHTEKQRLFKLGAQFEFISDAPGNLNLIFSLDFILTISKTDEI